MITGEIIVLRPAAQNVPPGVSLPAGPAGPPGANGSDGAPGPQGPPGATQDISGKLDTNGDGSSLVGVTKPADLADKLDKTGDGSGLAGVAKPADLVGKLPFASIGTTVSIQPSAFGNENSPETALSGDVSKIAVPLVHRITGIATLGQPTTGYRYTPEVYPHYTYLYNTSGWNQGTADNTGRTSAVAYRTKVLQAGQGDAVAYNASAFVTGAKAGATSFLANPAASLFNGDMLAGAAGVYLNPYEVILDDGGYDVAAVGTVNNLKRTIATGALGAVWSGVRVQSKGTAAIDESYGGTGLSKVGLNLTGFDFGMNQGAIAIKANQRIYGNATAGTNAFGVGTLNTDYFGYSTGINGWLFVVGNGAALQINAAQVTASKLFYASVGLRVAPTTPPTTATDAGVAGAVTWDANFIYICVATNTWRRTALASW
jgi:hypothetical protein